MAKTYTAPCSLHSGLHAWEPVELTQVVLSSVMDSFIFGVSRSQPYLLARVGISNSFALFPDLILSLFVGSLTHSLWTNRHKSLVLLTSSIRVVSIVGGRHDLLYVVLTIGSDHW